MFHPLFFNFFMLMSSIAFEEKLKKLNINLYIDKEHITYATNNKLGSSGIYLKFKKRDYINVYGLDWQDRIAAEKNNNTDDYITWVTKHIVYESDQFDDNGKCVALGWRSILKNLIKQRVTTPEKCRKVFGWEESDYDRLSFEEKRALCLPRSTDIHVTNL